MRQLLMNMQGTVVTRMPRPIVQPGTVLVRVHYSLVSVGTEIAPLRPAHIAAPDTTALDRAVDRAKLAQHYFKASLRDPQKAARRVSQIAARRLARMKPTAAGGADGGEAAASSDRLAQGWAIGYSVAGEVLEVGDGVNDLVPGDLVACAGAGVANHADFVVAPRNLVCPVPRGCDLKSACSATLGAIAMQGVRRASPQLGERVCVLGLGLIGQITVQLLRAAGCTVIGLDLDPARVARAKEFGLDAGATTPDALREAIRDLTGGHGADATLMTAATKSDAVINLAMDVTRPKGKVIIVGDVGLGADRTAFYRKEIDLLMSTSYGPGRYDASYEIAGHDYPYGYVRWTLNRNLESYLELIASGKVDFARLIDRELSVEEAPAVYDELARAEGPLPLGVVIRYLDVAESDATQITLAGHRRAGADRVRYALVGPGAFALGMLIPQAKRRKDRFFLRAVVSRTGSNGSNFAREEQVEVLTSNLDDVLVDPEIDMVMIATRHHEHASQVARALKAGKHVFVEKPLAISWDQLEEVVAAYRDPSRQGELLVGFNRRFSPALQALRERVKTRRAPMVLEYRLNAGYLPLDHWVHGAHGGGRNVGEACHMYDVFRFLTGAPAVAITATPIDPGTLPYNRNDNFSTTIRYEDGSIATLVYTALGPKTGMGKEHLTVFCDGEAFIVDDYKRLTQATNNAVLWQSGEADKGHFEELSRFGDAMAAGAPSPIPFDELVETTAVSLHVEDLLFDRVASGDLP